MNRQLLLEKVLEDIIKDSKQTDPQRIEKAETLISTFKEVDKWGIFHFLTTSETTPGLEHKQEIYWPSIHQFKELYQSGGHITLEDFVNLIENNDIKVTCTDKSFLYWAWMYKANKQKYGITVQNKAPTRNNVRLHGGSCFVAGTEVATKNGFKNIEDIKPGDFVYTHKGNLKRVRAISSHYDKTIKIKIGRNIIQCTPNHRFYCNRFNSTQKFEWIEAKDLNHNTYLTSPILRSKESEQIDVKKAFMLGWYLADGCMSWKKNRENSKCFQKYNRTFYDITYTIRSDKIKYAKEILKEYKTTQKDEINIRVHDQELIKFILKYSTPTLKDIKVEKSISYEVMNWNREARIALLQGFFCGDGTYGKSINGSNMTWINTNKDLLEVLYFISRSLGYSYWFSNKLRKIVKNPNGVNECPKQLHNFKVSLGDINQYTNELLESIKGVNVKFTEKTHNSIGNYLMFYMDKKLEADSQIVYNLEVEDDESYLVTRQMLAVHNCKHILSVLMLISEDPSTQEKMAKQLDEMLSKTYGNGKVSSEFSDIDDSTDQELPKVQDIDSEQPNDEEIEELTTEEFDAMEKHLIDIIDSYDIVTNEVVNEISRLTPDERSKLLSNILEYIDTQGIDYNELKVQSVLDLLDWEG